MLRFLLNRNTGLFLFAMKKSRIYVVVNLEDSAFIMEVVGNG